MTERERQEPSERVDRGQTADHIPNPDAPSGAENDAAFVRKLESVAVLVCWECRSVTFDESPWFPHGCSACGSKGRVIPMVVRERLHSQPSEEAIEAAAREVLDYASGMGVYNHTGFLEKVNVILRRHFGADDGR